MSVQPPADHPQLVWLYGHPVKHSLSPRIHNAAFKEQRLHFEYAARDVPPRDLSAAIIDLRSPNVRGANITLPHKQTVIPLLDEVTTEADRIGAVNTIVNKGGCLIGHNTDVFGFRQALRSVSPSGAAGLSCMVLGAGGAARAVVAALLQEDPAQIWVANRTLVRADALCEAASAWGSAPCVPIPLTEARPCIREADLVINATSLGLADSFKELPLDVDTLHGSQVLVDIVYRNGSTALVDIAQTKGIAAIDGKEMLLQQAARSYELWTGRKAPLHVMRENIEDRAR